MNKLLTLLILLFVGTRSHGQVSGEIKDAKRKIESPIDYTLYATSKTGYFTFKIAVNEAGKVTSCALDKSLSTAMSTPLMMQAKNRILAELKFEANSRYPKFQQGLVKITLVNIKDQNDEEKKVEGAKP